MIFTERISKYRNQAGELIITVRSIGVQTSRPVEKTES
jgi:hypothetical protein